MTAMPCITPRRFPGKRTNRYPFLIQYGALDAHTEPANQAARQFIYAVFMENTSRVAALIQAAPEMIHEHYARGETALHHACRNGNLDVVRVLVESGSNVNALSGI